MANHKSAIKRNKQSLKRREKNRTVKGALRSTIKKIHTAVASGSEEAREILASAIPEIAKAASKGIIHKNNAARKISRLTKKVNKAASAEKGA